MTERNPRPKSARDLMTKPDVLIPLETTVPAAASLLNSADVEAAPVVDSVGRCVGVFSAADYRRWAAARNAWRGEVYCDWQIVPGAADSDEVRNHMSRHYAVATPFAEVSELLHRLNEAPDQYVVVLDRQKRPQGMVFARDLLRSESVTRKARRDLVSVG